MRQRLGAHDVGVGGRWRITLGGASSLTARRRAAGSSSDLPTVVTGFRRPIRVVQGVQLVLAGDPEQDCQSTWLTAVHLSWTHGLCAETLLCLGLDMTSRAQSQTRL